MQRTIQASLSIGLVWASVAEAQAPPPLNGADAMYEDAVTIAAEQDWPVSATLNFLYQQTDFNELVHQLETNYAANFSAAENIQAPGYSGKIYFVGTVPAGAQTLITASGLPVNVYTGATETAIQIEAHADAVADELELQGYTDFVVSYETDGTVEVVVGNGAPLPTLPSAIGYNVVMSQSTGPTSDEDLARGGMFTLGTSCTTGFNVYHVASGITGTTTAAHCDGVNGAFDDLSTIVLANPAEDEHYGKWGDMQWHETPNDDETNSIWYRDASPVGLRRAITKVEPTFTKYSWYCNYGRNTKDDCDSVRRISVRKWSVRRLVGMHEREKGGGDSGGPWYRGEYAAGLHHGALWSPGWRDLFTKAHYLDEGLGVKVKTYPN